MTSATANVRASLYSSGSGPELIAGAAESESVAEPKIRIDGEAVHFEINSLERMLRLRSQTEVIQVRGALLW